MSRAIRALVDPLGPCIAAQVWMSSLPEGITLEEAWRRIPDDDWRDWLRRAVANRPEWAPVIARIPDLDDGVEQRPAAPRKDIGHETRAFFTRLGGAGYVRKAVVRCETCNGNGCSWCNEKGRVRVEPLHPAATWTLEALAAIPPQRTGCANG